MLSTPNPNFNPYEYMLSIRNNKILFQYLEFCNVKFLEDKGWLIEGETSYGFSQIYPLSNHLIRIVLPIEVPLFISPDFLINIIMSVQPGLEGILSLSSLNPDDLYLEYSMHVVSECNTSLTSALMKFLQEKQAIIKIFNTVTEDFSKVEKKKESSEQ